VCEREELTWSFFISFLLVAFYFDRLYGDIRAPVLRAMLLLLHGQENALYICLFSNLLKLSVFFIIFCMGFAKF
jgi:hypothetical protein